MVNTKNTLWIKVVNQLKTEIDNFLIYDSLLKTPISVEQNVININAPTIIKMLLTSEYQAKFQSILNNVFEKNMQISYVDNLKNSNDLSLEKKDYQQEKDDSFQQSTNVCESMLVSNEFVIHKGNKNAYEACLHLLNSRLKILYLFGSVGIGKTHLIKKIISEKASEMFKTKYITSHDLSNEYYNFLSQNILNQDIFVDKFLKYDLLVIDDFQNFESKENINKMLLLIVDKMLMLNKKIIIISQINCNDLTNFPTALISRISSGLTINVIPPDKLTMEIIITKFMKENYPNISFNKIACDFIATMFGNDVRKVFGWLDTLIFYLGNVKTVKVINKERLEQLLKISNIFKDVATSINTNPHHLPLICEKVGITVAEVQGKSRKQEIVSRRNLIIYILKTVYEITHVQIGKLLNRNHSTITNSLTNIEAEINSKKEYKEYVDNIISVLNVGTE